MDVRYEVLQGVQRDLRSGTDPTEVFKGLEQMRDRERQLSGGNMTMNDLRSFYRHMFAQDVLGMKEMWGVQGAIANVQRQLSRHWVALRKL
jgi:predicted HD phosphohydrolase